MFEQFVNLVLQNILEIVLSAISLVITRYAIPYIKNDLIPWLKEKRIYGTVKNLVQAVEKMSEAGIIQKTDKKAKVIELLEKNGIVVDETVDAFIESCVKELDMVTDTFFEGIMDEVN